MTSKNDNKQISQFTSLDAMSISTPEEKLAKELEESQLLDQPKYSTHQVFGARCQPPIKVTDVPPPISAPSNSEDGWGDHLPSYTSISMHHRFGYQSVLSSDHLPLIKPNEDGSPRPPPRLFGGYSGQAVVFGAGAQAKNEE
ncbi:hypothetical protein INT43_003950 [Umbelopsis isabellina]|uniref:Uncharacterized protein n=1 Tax=Mortierella isabellina TaxID=91625 RepID=A0A8H7PTQ0_MORIS|nr:hypothetical protein INT43_003950 [Umbelopsis isabellina]